MANDDKIEMEGTVVDCAPGSKFKVLLNEVEKEVLCTLAGKLRKNNIRVLRGDNVTIALSPYDLTKGIITWRHK